jgi:hypothetical protein
MRTMPNKQKGMGMSGILFVIVVAIFVVTVTFKLGPAYMGFWTLTSIMNDVSRSPEPILGGKPAIMSAVENRMMINEVRNIDSKSFTVRRVGEDEFELSVAYERREHLFFNIDAVLSFSYSVMVKGK